MLSPLVLAGIILALVSSTSATLLFRDVHAARLRERVSGIRSHFEEQASPTPARPVAIRLTGQRSERAAQLMRLLRFNPDIALQNVIPWKLVIAIPGRRYEAAKFLSLPLDRTSPGECRPA